MRRKGAAILMALVAGLFQAGPLIACAVACGPATCPMQVEETKCCESQAKEPHNPADCKCVVSAPEITAPTTVAVPQPEFAFDRPAPVAIEQAQECFIPSARISCAENTGPPGLHTASATQNRAPPVA
ncbi:MAG: hypothetical protein KIT74_02425 [Fimbriimonadales bacterium]|nr:hypothetical protein [Fimbriimonadales bacterium]